MNYIVNIGIGHIHSHPDNPRKDLGGYDGIGGVDQEGWCHAESDGHSPGRKTRGIYGHRRAKEICCGETGRDSR